MAAGVTAVGFGTKGEAKGRSPHAATVLDMNIAEYERRYEGPYDLLIGSRLAGAYATRFAAAADPADLERALQVTTELVEAWPDKRGLQGRLAALYVSTHGFAEAFRLAGEIVRADSTHQGALGVWFDAAMALGRYDTAADALERIDADSFGRRIREARWLESHGETLEASRLMRGACERVEEAAVSRLVVAWCFTRLAEMETGAAAAGWQDRALAAWPDYRGVREARADAAYADGRWKEARGLYRGLRSDAHPDIYLRLAETAEAVGDRAEARVWRDTFVRVAARPEVEALFAHALAVHLASADSTTSEAVAVMRRDIERRPSLESYAIYAWTLLRDGRPEAALEAARAAGSWGRPTIEIRYLSALALEALGRADEAASHRVATERDPGALPHHLQRELRSGR